MSERPTISAIVISYFGRSFLPDCLRTLRDDLAELSYELIVVDNGSTDGSVEYVREHFPEATIVANADNLGFAPAVNQGIEASQGEYVYILNQDLRFGRGTASALLARLKQDESIGMVGPKYVGFDGRLQRSARAFPTYRHVVYHLLMLDKLFPTSREFSSWKMGWFDHEREMFVDQPMGAVMMIPRRVVDEIGLMDESFRILFNDVDYCRRMAEAGYKRLYYPEAVVEHYVGGSTGRRPFWLKWVSHRALYRYLAKWAKWYEYPVLWLCGFLLLIGLPFKWALAIFTRPRSTTSAKPSSELR